MKKVIVRLGNGLGNQLFIYASAYSFAKKHNAILFIDDESGFYKRYKYELEDFNLSAPIVEKKHKFLGIYGRLKRKLLINIDRFRENKNFLIEKKNKNKLTRFDPEQFNIKFNKNLYFEGYFQSEKYFYHDIEKILKEFTFNNKIKNYKSFFSKEISNTNSVSIHIRQKRFLESEGHKNLYKLNNEYLKYNIDLTNKGIEYFDKNLENPKYFVWSNDFNSLREYFPSNKFIFVDENLKKKPIYDLYLMSLCKHFILSPSTLHYWGAFLSNNKDKICLSPKKDIFKNSYYGFSNNENIKADWWKEI